ncbi:MAG: GC-type dockerin domain-anchored protein [Planctomycetota bacterium]
MQCIRTAVAGFVGLLTGAAAAQSASATLSAANAVIAPGETITVTLEIDAAGGAAGPGVFGAAGLFGFAGTISATGEASSGATVDAAAVSSLLGFGQTATAGTGSSLLAIGGGRGLDDVPTAGTLAAATFDLTVGPEASGSITLTFDGAVVLSLGDALVTYATAPGVNQQSLAPTTLELTVGGGRLCADVNGDNEINGSDFFAWVNAFGAQSIVPCDVNADGFCDGSDFFAWVNFFGNPAADPGDCQPLP